MPCAGSLSESLEKEGTNPCSSGLGVLFGSHNQCFGIGPFLSISNHQVPASCPGVTLHLQGTCSESFPEDFLSPSFHFRPHVAFCKGSESRFTLKVCPHQSSLSYACHCLAWLRRHFPFSLSLLTFFLSVNTQPSDTHICCPLFSRSLLKTQPKAHLQEVFWFGTR